MSLAFVSLVWNRCNHLDRIFLLLEIEVFLFKLENNWH